MLPVDYLDRLTAAWSQSSSGCPGTAPGGTGLGGPAPYQPTLSYAPAGRRTAALRARAAGHDNTLISGPSSAQASTAMVYPDPSDGAARSHAPSSAAVTAGGQVSKTSYTWNGAQPGDLSLVASTPAGGTAAQVASFDWDGNGVVPGHGRRR